MTVILKRRNLIAAAAAAFATGVAEHAKADAWGIDTNTFALTDAQKRKHYIRFPKLDTESQMDFVAGFKRMQQEYGGPNAHPERIKFVQSLGYDPTVDTELSFEDCHKLLLQDPKYGAYVRLSRSVQELMWARARQALYTNEDLYMSAMESTDKAGPGSLELNPTMDVPEYTRYEIHQQPGGYVGDQFSGMLYHYALATAFYQGLFNGTVVHDEPHTLLAARAPVPEDGRLKRILEVGCSDGRTTMALKERFPDAEVWGIDVGGPMVRYAHHRAAGMGLDVHFAQRLAEDTKFPDGHFDLVVTNLIFHEASAAATRKIVPEIYRIMRKGAVWHLTDGGFGHPVLKRPKTIIYKAAIWVNHRYNNETWEVQWNGVDMYDLLRKTGFAMDPQNPQWVPIKA
jgi:SAM-dependent methyltransferase